MLTDIFEQIEKGGAPRRPRAAAISTSACGCRSCRATPATATAPALRVHRQQVRVPRRVVDQSIALPTSPQRRRGRSLDYIATELEKALQGRQDPRGRRQELLTSMIKEHKRIIFNGNSYSDEWQKEAGKRGLLNLKNTVDALPELSSRRSRGVREVQGAHRARAARALRGRARDLLQDHQHRGAADGADGQPLHPAGGARYQKEVGESVAAGKAAGGADKEGKKLLDEWSSRSTRCRRRPTRSEAARARSATAVAEKHAKYLRDKVVPAMAALRELGRPARADGRRTNCGRCRRIGRCCSSSRSSVSSCQVQPGRLKGAPAFLTPCPTPT